MTTCPFCGARFAGQGLAALDPAFAAVIGGDPGELCEECAAAVACGTPSEIDDLLGRSPCPDCGEYENCNCEEGVR